MQEMPKEPAGTGTTATWALLNLILCVLGAALAVVFTIRVVVRNGRPQMIIAAIILATAGFIVFMLTENMKLAMAYFDILTIANALILIVELIFIRLAFRTESEDDEFDYYMD